MIQDRYIKHLLLSRFLLFQLNPLELQDTTRKSRKTLNVSCDMEDKRRQ